MNFTTQVAGTIEDIPALLRPAEQVLATQFGVALYDRKEPSTLHADGTLCLTTQRLFYFPTHLPRKHSRALELRTIKQTQYWIGIYFKSSPKIILILSSSSSSPPLATNLTPNLSDEGGNWVCGLCGMSNSLLGSKCSLCGVNKSAQSTRPSTPTTILPTSSPSPSFRTTTPTPAPIVVPLKTADGRIACPKCTYLNHPSMKKCELCDHSLRLSSSSTPTSSVSPRSTTAMPNGSPALEEINKENYIKVSFRKGGEKVLYAALKVALANKEWENESPVGVSAKRSGGGIDEIMKSIATASKETEDEMDDALKDLDALMLRAKDMIILAKSMNEKLSLQESSSNLSSDSTSTPQSTAKETTSIRTSLLTLGLSTPAITPDMLAKDQEYHRELAGELEGVLRGVMGMEGRGIVGLDEVWCLWNRARGVSLISPKDLKLSLPFLSFSSQSSRSSATSMRITPLTLPSGITVLHTSEFSPESFSRRLLDLIDLRMTLFLSTSTTSSSAAPTKGDKVTSVRNGLSSIEIAREVGAGIPFGLIKELLEIIEMEGNICRDDIGVEGVLWFRNYFVVA